MYVKIRLNDAANILYHYLQVIISKGPVLVQDQVWLWARVIEQYWTGLCVQNMEYIYFFKEKYI